MTCSATDTLTAERRAVLMLSAALEKLIAADSNRFHLRTRSPDRTDIALVSHLCRLTRGWLAGHITADQFSGLVHKNITALRPAPDAAWYLGTLRADRSLAVAAKEFETALREDDSLEYLVWMAEELEHGRDEARRRRRAATRTERSRS